MKEIDLDCVEYNDLFIEKSELTEEKQSRNIDIPQINTCIYAHLLIFLSFTTALSGCLC